MMAAALLFGPWILLFVSTPTYHICNSLRAVQGAVGRETERKRESGAAAAESEGSNPTPFAKGGINLTEHKINKNP